MNGKMISCFGIIVFLVVLLSGCTSTPYGDQAISLDALEGRWIGDGESHLATTTTTCTINLRIGFIVRDGRAISLCSDPRCTFDVPVEENGTLRFKFRKALNYSSDYAGSEKRDINFSGQLSPEEGRGTFASGGCVGKWQVTKQTAAMQEADKQARELREQAVRTEKSASVARKAQEVSEPLSPEETEALFAAGSKKTVRARQRQGWNTYKLSCSKDRWCHLGSHALVISPVSEEGTFSIFSNDHWIKWLLSRKARAIRKGDGSIHIIDHVYAKPQTMWIIDK